MIFNAKTSLGLGCGEGATLGTALCTNSIYLNSDTLKCRD